MKLAVALLSSLALTAATGEAPELRSWVMAASPSPVAPEVHSVRADENFVYVESAGLSLHSFGAFEANQYDAPLGPRHFEFKIPRHPQPATGEHMSTPLGVIGVFVTGVPIYNPIGTASFRDQNLWHLDAVRASVAGVSRLVTSLNANPLKHSPIIGYALDGYPIYGPFGYDQAGTVHRMKSSYRLRSMVHRTTLPDGTLLTPAQEGPDVGAPYPLGTFAEDYEYAKGTGDLDEFNGRFTRTPDYPEGTYAYFLTGWPWLIGPRYYGAMPVTIPRANPRAGEPATLTLAFPDKRGRNIRFLEKVHEKQIHLIVVSDDLSEFAHIHPEPASGDVFAVTHTFAHGGDYTMYADYTAPGAGPSVRTKHIHVAGKPIAPVPLCPDTSFTKPVDGVAVTLHLPARLKAGADLPLTFTLSTAGLDPYLGAWAHIMLVSADRKTFIHAHPLENTPPGAGPRVHVHSAPPAGPSPSTISTVTGFRNPGLYKLWFQFQRNGVVSVVSWVFKVAPSDALMLSTAAPKNAIAIRVSSEGFSPSRVVIPANRPARLAFTRSDAQNCAREVVFPDLRIHRELPAGRTVVIDLPPSSPGELHFACGMGMFKGALIVRNGDTI